MTTLLTDELATAQEAIHLPEVQEMVKRLAAYNLGVFMPHMHEADGTVTLLPDGVVQVEDDLRVLFQSQDQLTETPGNRYMPVGWRWSEQYQRIVSGTVCRVEKQSDGNYKHVQVSSQH